MKHHSPSEQQTRRRLGIPDDAERVILFTESSHWDPNWLYTADEYFERFVRKNLDQALQYLQQEPRRIYSVESIFFLRQYWDRCPEQRERIREFVNEGRLRLTSSSVTTADTLLPSTEAILRDFLIGQEWLRANGMKQEPRLAYFPDSFGCTPSLPSILNAAGFDRTAITRLDGMYFIGCDLEWPRRFPRKGSSAERLLIQARTLDFVWRDQAGAQVLCHWNAFTYGQGDMLAYVGISRIYLIGLAISLRTDWHIARRIRQYVNQLAPYCRTPYMLCPIGFDFVEPIPDLTRLLDRYNQKHYPRTGIWAINAGLDDYFALIEPYKDQLPVLELDPNPYWTGFYTSRPTLKQRCRKQVDDLLLAEKLSFLPENAGAERTISHELEDAWWKAVISNHHDFITGTSPDRVVEEEQIPWLDQAADSADAILNRLASAVPATNGQSTSSGPVTWSRQGSRIHIDTAFYHIELAEDSGGAIMELRARETHIPLLADISNDIVSYRDSGGLWRMGYEFAGGVWKESTRASLYPVQMQVLEHDTGVEVVSTIELNGELIRRRIWFSNESPLIHCRIEGKAAEGYTVVVRFTTGISTTKLVMDTPGGIITRPPKRIYDPTFWPLHRFVHIQDEHNGRGLAILQPMPGAISYQPDGRIELVAMRNATREKAFGLIHLPANPASGHEHESYTFEYALLFTEKGNWRDNDIFLLARELSSPWSSPRESALRHLAASIITTDDPNVWVTAIKPASRGEGIIVRLNAFVVPQSPVRISAHHLKVAKATLCDARERDIRPLDVEDSAVWITMPGTIATIRLEPI